ncbi:fatty acid synthase [Lasius niger]|uniref:oleoyl-[acyl-carrier-protein] hydrolase n=1 Tax=Lasius niger TaxID=67767 RepID=A0A0J7K1P4_LASNI|nr:fatty acid synthase [Lasius niger]
MANSVMERICERRMKEGLHGLAIQWGAIGDVGLVADMQEDDKELVIGGTLQQEISSCMNTLELFLLQDRAIVSSMVVAEKKRGFGRATNPLEAVANIMGLKNPNIVAPNISLAELGLDSMMAVEIKQTLEREFDILLTAQDIRNLNFAELRKMTNTAEHEKMYDVIKADTNDLDGLRMLTRKLNDSDLSPDIYIEVGTKGEVAGSEIFLIPGVDGCARVYKLVESKIKSSAICLQHGVLNTPGHILQKLRSQKKFLIVGYSFGSLIAIELARLLEAKNFSGRLILIDGAPDLMKFLIENVLNHPSEQELQNDILLRLMKMYLEFNNEMLLLELNKCNTWEEKLEVITHFTKEINVLTVENKKFLCSTVYDHIIAVQDYNISSMPRLKSSIILLKPTLTPFTFIEEDYGLHKVTEGAVQIHYVEGTHITIMDNDKITSFINEAL